MSEAIGNPYKGLAPFEDSERDVLFFFGRDRERERITANLIGSRLTVLYGETGAGKTSVLRAGVAHQLRAFDEPLAVVVFDEWRDEPAAGLARAVAQAAGTEAAESLADTLERCSATVGGDLYLILDGVEEYFLYYPVEDREHGFGVQLAQAVRRPGLRARVLLSLREDAVIKLDRFKRVIPNLFGNYLRLDHLDREAARAAILGPLERYGELVGSDQRIEIEPELVEAVLDEVTAGHVEFDPAGQGAVAREPDGRVATPYLQLVMHRLWEEETGAGSSILRLSTLRALGGAESIVRNHLQRALEALTPAQQDIASEGFDHLVTPSGTKVAHTAPDLARYAGVAEDELLPVLQALVDERIVRPTADETGTARYEIYHDVLAEAVAAWRAQHESAREVEAVRQAAARKHRRLLVVAVVALLLAGAMAAVTIFALSQRSEARTQARKARAEARTTLARSLDASALSELQSDPELSLLLAVEAARREPDRFAGDVLRRALLESRVRARFRGAGPVTAVRESPDGTRILVAGGRKAFVYKSQLRRPEPPLLKLPQRARITAADYSPTGSLILTAGADGHVRLWSAPTGRLLHELRAGAPVQSAMFDSIGSRLAVAGGHTVIVWRAEGALIFAHSFPWRVTDAVFSPDDRLLAVIGDHRAVLLYDSHGRLKRALPQGDVVTNVAFKPDGKLLFAAGRGGSALLWDTRTGKVRRSLKCNCQTLAAAFSPDGTQLATGSSDTIARIWDVASGKQINSLTGHTHFVVDLAFRADGKYLATSSSDGTVRIWRAKTGQLQTVLAGHSDTVTQVVYGHTRSTRNLVLTGSADGTARVWAPPDIPRLQALAPSFAPTLAGASYVGKGTRILTAGPGREALLVRASDGRRLRGFRIDALVTAAAASPDGKLVAVGGDRSVVVFDTSSTRASSRYRQPSAVTAVAFSPTAARLVVGGQDGVARVWNLRGGPPGRLKGHSGRITAVAFSPNGRRIATASADGTARIWDATAGRSLVPLRGDTGSALTSVSWSPDSRLLVTAGADTDAILWDAGTGARKQILRWHLGPLSGASFSPNGQWIVTTGPTLLQLWQPGIGDPVFRFGIIGTEGMTKTTFDPSSTRLLTANGHGTLLTYACGICGSVDELLGVARERLAVTGRTLTADEHKRYGV